MGFTIFDDETPSALYSGYAKKVFEAGFINPAKAIIVQAKNIGQQIFNVALDIPGYLLKGFKAYTSWFNDDPIPATAAAIAVGASLGLMLVVGGAVGGSIIGGLSALQGLTLAGKIKLGLAAVGVIAPIGALIRFLIRGVQFTWSFNWNMTDKAIKTQQNTLVESLYSLAGTVVGSSLATVLCGVAPIQISQRANLIKINPMTLAMIRDITEFNPHSEQYGEIYEEMMEACKALIRGSARVTAQVQFLESYKNIRKWIKDTANKTHLDAIFPQLSDTIQKWGKEGSQAWSFSEATQDWTESISDQKIENFTEETIESFMDTCTENAMIISYLF